MNSFRPSIKTALDYAILEEYTRIKILQEYQHAVNEIELLNLFLEGISDEYEIDAEKDITLNDLKKSIDESEHSDEIKSNFFYSLVFEEVSTDKVKDKVRKIAQVRKKIRAEIQDLEKNKSELPPEKKTKKMEINSEIFSKKAESGDLMIQSKEIRGKDPQKEKKRTSKWKKASSLAKEIVSVNTKISDLNKKLKDVKEADDEKTKDEIKSEIDDLKSKRVDLQSELRSTITGIKKKEDSQKPEDKKEEPTKDPAEDPEEPEEPEEPTEDPSEDPEDTEEPSEEPTKDPEEPEDTEEPEDKKEEPEDVEDSDVKKEEIEKLNKAIDDLRNKIDKSQGIWDDQLSNLRTLTDELANMDSLKEVVRIERLKGMAQFNNRLLSIIENPEQKKEIKDKEAALKAAATKFQKTLDTAEKEADKKNEDNEGYQKAKSSAIKAEDKIEKEKQDDVNYSLGEDPGDKSTEPKSTDSEDSTDTKSEPAETSAVTKSKSPEEKEEESVDIKIENLTKKLEDAQKNIEIKKEKGEDTKSIEDNVEAIKKGLDDLKKDKSEIGESTNDTDARIWALEWTVEDLIYRTNNQLYSLND